MTGVAHQRPAWTIRFSKEVGHVGRAVESLFPFSGADPGLQVRSRFQSLHEARLDVVSNARELGDWPSDEDGRQPIVGGKGEQGITVAVVDFQAVESDAAPIREVP